MTQLFSRDSNEHFDNRMWKDYNKVLLNLETLMDDLDNKLWPFSGNIGWELERNIVLRSGSKSFTFHIRR